MSGTGPLGDLWTGRFLDYLGLGCILTSVEIAVKDGAYTGASVLTVVGGIILAAGLRWETVSPRIYPPLYASLRRIASPKNSLMLETN